MSTKSATSGGTFREELIFDIEHNGVTIQIKFEVVCWVVSAIMFSIMDKYKDICL